MTFGLGVVGKGQLDQLRNLKNSVQIELFDEAGQRICEAVGPLHDWALAWIPSGDTGYYWHINFRDVTVRRNGQYRLRLIVLDVDAGSPSLSVEPMLTGGGNELP